MRVEALDANDVTGPGVGLSEPIVLVVASPEDAHFALVAEQRALLEKLLASLADYLEAPAGPRALRADAWIQEAPADLGRALVPLAAAHEAAAAPLAEMASIAERLDVDPLAIGRDRAVFGALSTRLSALHARGARRLASARAAESGAAGRLARWAASNEAAYEKGILRFEDLLLAQKIADLEQTTAQIGEARERLKALLTEYKGSSDASKKAAIKREIARMRQRMAELMRRMGEQTEGLAAEHVNREALERARREAKPDRLSGDFDDIERLLDEDDVDGALAALERMGSELERVANSMKEGLERAEPQAISAFDKKMGELLDRANDLEELERGLAERTAQARRDDSARRRAESSNTIGPVARRLGADLARARARVDRIGGPLSDEIERDRSASSSMIEGAERALGAEDLEAAHERARAALRQMGEMRFSLGVAERYRFSSGPGALKGAMARLNPAIDEVGDVVSELGALLDEARDEAPRAGAAARGLAERQGEAAERARSLKDELESASRSMPGMGDELGPSAERAERAMRQAQSALERGEMQGAVDAQREAAEALRDLNRSMQQAAGRERGRSERNGRERDREEVVIPEGGAERGADRMREALDEGMKEERLDRYSSDIEDYFKSLVR